MDAKNGAVIGGFVVIEIFLGREKHISRPDLIEL